jgi:hypothetical protein
MNLDEASHFNCAFAISIMISGLWVSLKEGRSSLAQGNHGVLDLNREHDERNAE